MLPDIQDQADSRGIELDEVGISGVRYPVRLDDGSLTQSGVASFDVVVTLPADRRGTHMRGRKQPRHLRCIDPGRPDLRHPPARFARSAVVSSAPRPEGNKLCQLAP